MSFGSTIMASFIASLIFSATSRTWGILPISSGLKSLVWLTPMESLFPLGFFSASTTLLEKTVKWGERTPSVPPDITRETFPTTSSTGTARCFERRRAQEREASPLEKSLTRPFPSVFPIMATMSLGSTSPFLIASSILDTSPGSSIGTLRTFASITFMASQPYLL